MVRKTQSYQEECSDWYYSRSLSRDYKARCHVPWWYSSSPDALAV
jgi:hypothetical protein